MLGAFRTSLILRDGRNRFSKVIRMTQTRKRNSRERIKIIQENAAIIREGREALDRVNARIIAEHRQATAAPLKEQSQ